MRTLLSLTLGAVLALSACSASSAEKRESAPGRSLQEAPAAAVTEFKGGELLPDERLPIVIDFNAAWCGPCRMFKPVFHSVAETMAGRARFVSVNVDDCPEVARRFGVRSIPQISILYPDGLVKTAVGYMEEPDFRALVESWL